MDDLAKTTAPSAASTTVWHSVRDAHPRALPLLFIPLAFTLYLPPPWLALGYLLFPLYFVVRWRREGAAFPATRANLPILLLLVGVLIGLVVSPDRVSGAVSAGKLLTGLVTLYVLLDTLKQPDELWWGASLLVVVGLGLVLLLPFGVSWSIEKVYTLPSFLDWTLRPPGEGTNANLIAGMLALTLPLAVGLIRAPRAGMRILGAAAVGPLLLALLVLQSRNAWFAVLGGLAVGAALYRRWLVPVIPLALLAALALNQQLGGTWLTDVMFGKVGTITGGTLVERQQLWSQAIELVRAHPLTGIGMGAYEQVAPYAPPYSPQAPGLVAPHAHNLYLQVLLDAGLVGFVGLTGIFILAMIAVGRAYVRKLAAPLPLAVLVALAVVLIHSIGDSVFWGFKGGWMLWALLGLALAFDSVSESERGLASTRNENRRADAAQ